VLPPDLGGLLTAIVLITMAVTPVLGQVAGRVSKTYNNRSDNESVLTSTSADVSAQKVFQASSTSIANTIPSEVANNAIVVCGHGDIGRSTLQILVNEYEKTTSALLPRATDNDVPFRAPPKLVAFDTDPLLVDTCALISEDSVVLFGDAANPEVLMSSGISDPTAIFVSYEEQSEVVSAVSRLRAFFLAVPIYARSQTTLEAELLREAGANEVIVEQDKMKNLATTDVMLNRLSKEAVDALHGSTIASVKTVESEENALVLKIYNSIIAKYPSGGLSGDCVINADGLTNALRKSNRGITSDEELDRMEAWIRAAVPGVNGKRPINEDEFGELYRCSPPFVQDTLSGVMNLI